MYFRQVGPIRPLNEDLLKTQSRRSGHWPPAYVGFFTDDPARVHQAYPGSTWDRLVQVKARYDPTNLFHHDYNIPTAIGQPGQ